MQQQNNSIKYFFKALILFWLIAKIISIKLWLADRSFPLVPFANFLDTIPGWMHVCLYCLSIGVLVFCLFVFPSKKIFWLLFIVEIVSCVLDQNRWQPWQYQYIFMLLAFALYNNINEQKAISVSIFIIAFIYIYSGLHKFSHFYITRFWQDNILVEFFNLSEKTAHHSLLNKLGYATALAETLAGLGLLFTSSRKISAIALIAMHAFILLVIGPLGINYNIIVWPWNIAMMLFLYFGCIRSKQLPSFSFILLQAKNYLFVLLFAILPALSFFGYWDYYLSSSLYSGKTPSLKIIVQNAPKDFFLIKYAEDVEDNNTDTTYTIDIQDWAMQELSVPQYPELRIYSSIKEKLQKKYSSLKATFIVKMLVNGRRKEFELK